MGMPGRWLCCKAEQLWTTLGDALALVYRPENLPEFPTSWADLQASEAVMAFPAQSDQALFQLSLYEGEGGSIQDIQRRPVLELDITTIFHLIEDGVTEGLFVGDTTQYQTVTPGMDRISGWANGFGGGVGLRFLARWRC